MKLLQSFCRVEFVLFLLVLVLLVPVMASADIKDDLEYLGYSKELREYVSNQIQATHSKLQSGNSAFGMTPETGPIDEATSVQEQLTELARTRSLTPQTESATEKVKEKIDNFWSNLRHESSREIPTLTTEQKNMLKERIKTELTNAGFTIKQIDLIDAPPSLDIPQVRAVVRVVRPLKSKNPYREIQNNLSEIKELCQQATTIDGKHYLRELTTFIAENPQNNYYYEKTILTP